MQKGCLFATAILLFIGLLLFGAGAYVWSKRGAVMAKVEKAMELPEFASAEAVEAAHGETISRIRTAADEAESIFKFAAAIEDMELGEDVVYLRIDDPSGEETEVLKRWDWNGHSTKIFGEYGAGMLSVDGEKRAVVIVQPQGSWSYMEEYTIYFAHEKSDGDVTVSEDEVDAP